MAIACLPNLTTMSTATLIRKKAINTSIKWKEVDEKDYKAVAAALREIKADKVIGSAAKFETAVNIYTNNLFLIYERLYKHMARDVDYKELQNFAIESREMLRFLFSKVYDHSSLKVFEDWTKPSIDILECAMYRPANRYNKHIYH